ncbi:hypothetical protein ACF0H5_005216 [Mactra antiquata]
MPLHTKRSQASTTFYSRSVEPVSTRESQVQFRETNRSIMRSFRVLPSYPTPKPRRELTTNASVSSFRTSYVLADDSSDSNSDISTISNISREFWQKRALESGNYNVGESSDSESIESETVTNQTYSSIQLESPSKRLRKEIYRFIVDGTGAITDISSVSVGQCRISRFNDKLLHTYHRNGHKKDSRSISSNIHMHCTRQDKTVLVVPQFSKTVFKMAPSGKMSSFVSFELEIGGICYTSRNEILVTTAPVQKSQKKGPRPRTTPSVTRVSQTGEKIWEIKVKGIDPFVKPSKLTVNKNGDICVIDNEPTKEHVVILSPDGEEKKRYYGVQNKVLSHPFEPRDICCDKNGFLYITDLRNCAVHVLDSQGNFNHFLFTMHDGYQYPGPILYDSEGYIWIGLSTGTVIVFHTERNPVV